MENFESSFFFILLSCSFSITFDDQFVVLIVNYDCFFLSWLSLFDLSDLWLFIGSFPVEEASDSDSFIFLFDCFVQLFEWFLWFFVLLIHSFDHYFCDNFKVFQSLNYEIVWKEFFLMRWRRVELRRVMEFLQLMKLHVKYWFEIIDGWVLYCLYECMKLWWNYWVCLKISLSIFNLTCLSD